MFEDRTQTIKTALGGVFDRVLDLFDGIRMPEHRNELLCFVGIDGYTLSEAVYSSEKSGRTAELKYLVKALGARETTAKELCEKFDGEAVPALEGCGLSFKEIKRTSCAFLREQGCYCVSAELIAESFEPTGEEIKSVGFSLGELSLGCMSRYEISRTHRTAVTPTVGSGIITRSVGNMPLKVSVSGEMPADDAAKVYSQLSPYFGMACEALNVGGNAFAGMYMTELGMSGSADGRTKLTVGFTEVNGI